MLRLFTIRYNSLLQLALQLSGEGDLNQMTRVVRIDL